MKRITQMLHEVMETDGYSQSKVSRLSGVPQPTLSKWMADRAPKSAQHALSIHDLHSKLIRKRKPRTASPAQRDAKERA